jgi:hypothetical protein
MVATVAPLLSSGHCSEFKIALTPENTFHI